MKMALRWLTIGAATTWAAWTCAHDGTLREYLAYRFWLPFNWTASSQIRPEVPRMDTPYAGMAPVGNSSLGGLRAFYQKGIWAPPESLLAEVRALTSLTPRDREEVELIAAKIEMRRNEFQPEKQVAAKQMFQRFLLSAKSADFLSEARGWIAHIDYVNGNMTAAGKAYLDELNRAQSNLSLATLSNSLRMVYGSDGGEELEDHIAEYFDTPEHAAFAIRTLTSESPNRRATWKSASPNRAASIRKAIRLLEQHPELFARDTVGTVAAIGMRAALLLGDVPEAAKIEASIPSGSTLRQSPDFLWMRASVRFLSHNYQGAKTPLLALFQSKVATSWQRAAAAHGLVGVYSRLGNRVEQVRYALWLRTHWTIDTAQQGTDSWDYPLVYWASSGFDLGGLLDYQASVEELETFLTKYPPQRVADRNLVRYAIGVRLARQDRYEEAAAAYLRAGAPTRAARMKEAAKLYADGNDPTLTEEQRLENRYRFAEFLQNNVERVYFNDRIWNGFQREGLIATSDPRLPDNQRKSLAEAERKLRDDQEECWRAYKILQSVVDEAGHTPLGLKASYLGQTCLRLIRTDRFGRIEEVQEADIRLAKWRRNQRAEKTSRNAP